MVTQPHPFSTLALLHSTHHTTQVQSAQRRAARTLQPRRECIWSPAGQQDQEAPPSTGGVGCCSATAGPHQDRTHQRQPGNFVLKGKDQLTGVTLYRCARGTNDLEGFHTHMRSLVEWCVEAGVGSDLLLELSYRWNLDRSISNRGLDGSIGGFYGQSIIEAIPVRWACVQTQLRVYRGISVKLLLTLRVSFVFPHLVTDTTLGYPPVFFPAGDLLLTVFVSNHTLSVENELEPVRQGHVLRLDIY